MTLATGEDCGISLVVYERHACVVIRISPAKLVVLEVRAADTASMRCPPGGLSRSADLQQGDLRC